jgi:hypothetical protein
MENKFEYAVRNKLRFQYNGLVSVEDLWDMSPEVLDHIYKKLKKESKAADEESLLGKKTAEDEVLSVKIEIITYIVGVKLAEKEEKAQAKAKKEKKQQIMALIAEKDSEVLRNMPKEELQKMLDEM